MKTLYTAVATANDAGRNGRTRTDDGSLDLQLTMPEGMGGPGGEGTNPEQLFALGYSACFANAMRSVARRRSRRCRPWRSPWRMVFSVTTRGSTNCSR